MANNLSNQESLKCNLGGDIMKKISVILIFFVLFSGIANAKIRVEPNNLEGTVRYKTYKNYSPRELSLIKIVDQNDKSKYYLKILTYNSNTMYENKVKMEIDKKEYILNRFIVHQSPAWKYTRIYNEALYAIPENILEKMKIAKKIDFTVVDVFHQNKIIYLPLPAENLNEFKRMISLKFMDFNDKNIVNPKKTK